jgi:hypothetical protein
MPNATRGILETISLATEQPVVIYPTLREIFINETPLIARTRRVPATSEVFQIESYDVRPTNYTLGGALAAGDTTITLTDSTPLLVGDVLEVLDTAGAALERVEVTDLPSATTATIRRAREGTVAIANANTGGAPSKNVMLIGNSRTGSEIDQVAYRTTRTFVEQYVQTFQYPVQVGGKAQAVRNTVFPAGFDSVFTMEQQLKAQDMMREEERSCYYGIGEKPVNPGDRAKQKGLKKQISQYANGINVKTGAGGSYTKLMLVADGPQKIIDAGGEPDACLVSTDLMTAFATWTNSLEQITNPAQNRIGIPIREIYLSFLGPPITFIPSYQLKKGTMIFLTSRDVVIRPLREESWYQRGRRGDASEGDFIADLCVEIGHPGWHAIVEGITGYAP